MGEDLNNTQHILQFAVFPSFHRLVVFFHGFSNSVFVLCLANSCVLRLI